MRRDSKVDYNQELVIKVLRDAGATVCPLHHVGQGCPDLLVGFRGRNFLLEVKNPRRRGAKLTEDQQIWHESWKGQVAVVESAPEALRLICR